MTPFSFGVTITPEQVNYDVTSPYGGGQKGLYRGQTVPVGSLPARLYEMHGNVWEWCLDGWHENYTGAPGDASAWTEKKGRNSESIRVVRGGSWFIYPWLCRSAFRDGSAPDDRNYYLGFRLARTLS